MIGDIHDDQPDDRVYEKVLADKISHLKVTNERRI